MRKSARDLINVADRGFARLRNRAGAIIAGRDFSSPDLDKPVVEVKGWVNIVARERGKIVARRDGHNIWTNTGREYLALLMSIQTGPSTGFRNDRVAYIGVGTGSQIEDAGVLNLVTPVSYVSNVFLAPLDIPPSFPLTPTRTTVRYHRLFAVNEITTAPGQRVDVSELGLFTNGDPGASYAPGTRQLGISTAGAQNPVAYKSFEPIGKTDSLELEVSWEIRF